MTLEEILELKFKKKCSSPCHCCFCLSDKYKKSQYKKKIITSY